MLPSATVWIQCLHIYIFFRTGNTVYKDALYFTHNPISRNMTNVCIENCDCFYTTNFVNTVILGKWRLSKEQLCHMLEFLFCKVPSSPYWSHLKIEGKPMKCWKLANQYQINIIINQKSFHLSVHFQGLGLYSIDNDLNLKEKLYSWLYPTIFIKIYLPCYQTILIKGEKIGTINFNNSCLL